MDHVGTHIKKDKFFKKSLIDFFSKTEEIVPVQIFSGSRTSWARPKRNEKDEKDTLEYVKEWNIKLYIHSIYFINLSRKDDEKSLAALLYEIELGPCIGCSGVVVHVGKYLKESEELSEKSMKWNIDKIIDKIDKKCPLLIETPAGQGTEILTKKEKFVDFVNMFDDRIGACVDTCHVFASGYDPLEYLTYVKDNIKDKTIIVHFNDSKCEKASRKDRHEFPGEGLIGNSLMKCAEFCKRHNIPAMMEV